MLRSNYQDEIQILKNQLNSLNYANQSSLDILGDINEVLIYGQIPQNEKTYFVEKYNEIIDQIELNNLFEDCSVLFEYKAYSYYLKGRTKRLRTLINTQQTLRKNNDLIVLLIELLIRDKYPVDVVFPYVNGIIQNKIEDNYTFNNLKRLLVGAYEFNLNQIRSLGVNKFSIAPNDYLSLEILGFYHTKYTRYREIGNPDYINVLKNTFSDCHIDVLMSAKKQLREVLVNDLRMIFQELGINDLTVCVIPRAKAENSYNENQLIFKNTISEVANDLQLLKNGVNYITRICNTKTTHLKNTNISNDGRMPYKGIAKDTCDFSAKLNGANILLIDDIYTYGVNIIEDFIQELLNLGVKNVYFYSIGRAGKF